MARGGGGWARLLGVLLRSKLHLVAFCLFKLCCAASRLPFAQLVVTGSAVHSHGVPNSLSTSLFLSLPHSTASIASRKKYEKCLHLFLCGHVQTGRVRERGTHTYRQRHSITSLLWLCCSAFHIKCDYFGNAQRRLAPPTTTNRRENVEQRRQQQRRACLSGNPMNRKANAMPQRIPGSVPPPPSHSHPAHPSQ